MEGNESAGYKYVQRFLETNDLREVLVRLFREEAPFVIGDPTEMPRPHAKKTGYVGILSDSETRAIGFCCWRYHSKGVPYQVVL